MKTTLCTLYNSLYLDKGLALYDSLKGCAHDFELYVLCMDDKCYEVLSELHCDYQIPIRLEDFEKDDIDLIAAKANRPQGEYCWTCSSSFIRFILNHFNKPICTYIDADMYFYQDPQALVDEMIDAGKSVMVTPHRFHKKNEKLAQKVGKYCVEFNTFRNDEKGLEVLDYWRNRCLECCSNIGDGVHWGDQKYLDEIVEKYDCVHVCSHPGAGVAPWNILLYKYDKNENYNLFFKPDELLIPLIFYHYQGVKYVNRKEIITSIPANNRSIDYELVNLLYQDYLERIEKKKQMLEEQYNINFLIKKHPVVRNISSYRRFFHRTWIYKVFLKFYFLCKGAVPYKVVLDFE